MTDLAEKLLDKEIDVEADIAALSPLVPQQGDQVVPDGALLNHEISVAPTGSAHGNSAITVGEKQPDGFRDVFAAVLFLGHLGAIVYLAFAWGFPSLNYKYSSFGSTGEVHFSGVLFLCLISSLAALVLSGIALHVMTLYAERLVQIGLTFSIVCNVLLAIVFLVEGYFLGMVMALLFAAIGACYAAAVWRRIPFAASNLTFALTAVKTNGGIVVAAFGITALVQLYTVLWIVAWLGVYVRHAQCDNGQCTSHVNGFVVMLFLLSYYWTTEVGKNLLNVTVAGVVGTFVFAPDDASHFCSPCITDSLARASTWSFGSVCLGSLLTAILQLLYQMCRQASRQGRNNALLLCIFECLVGLFERLVAYFNKWAYCYIGLYGYDYLTAGKNVINLFRDRGWQTLITDNLVVRTLSLLSLVVGLCTGAVGLFVASLVPQWVEATGIAVAFVLPTLLGTAMAYILFLSVVGAAVDTVIVIMAESPLELERNHPGLYHQMITAWRLVYSDEFVS